MSPEAIRSLYTGFHLAAEPLQAARCAEEPPVRALLDRLASRPASSSASSSSWKGAEPRRGCWVSRSSGHGA